MKRFLLLNQFGSNSGAPTGRILAELKLELERRGDHVVFLSSDSTYGKPRRGLGRLMQEGFSHMSLFWKSLWCSKADIIISLTSPACLAITAAVIAKMHRAKHFHWVMDLYPEVGVRLGELRGGYLVRLLSYFMRQAYQRSDHIIALDEDMSDYLQNIYEVRSTVIEPFPPEVIWPKIQENQKPTKQWLYSGNFGRAHEIKVLLQIQKKLEERQLDACLILQGQGPQFLSNTDSIKNLGLRKVQWRAPVPQEKLGESLLQCDVLVVTRKIEMKGLLLPSKLMLAELSGRSVLWIGDKDGKTAQRLFKEGRHGVFAVEDIESIASWLQELFEQEALKQAIPPRATHAMREKAINQWEAILCQNGHYSK